MAKKSSKKAGGFTGHDQAGRSVLRRHRADNGVLVDRTMINIISYSGGLGSAISAHLVKQTYPNDELVLLFADTLMEDEDLYRFNSDIEKLLGVSITVISAGKTPWQVFEQVKYQGNTRIDPCSKILKRDLIRKWLERNYTPDECTVWIGIDCSEEHRLPPVRDRNKPFVYRSILIERDIFLTPDSKVEWCKTHNITLPALYRRGFSHNNCGGFCVKAGQAHFAKLYKEMPDRYLHHEEQQEALMRAVPTVKPFLRKTVNGKLKYLTLKEYRLQFLEQGGEIDSTDFGGCGCAL